MATGVMCAEDTFDLATTYANIAVGGGPNTVFRTAMPYAAFPPLGGSPFEIVQVRFINLTGWTAETQIQFYFTRTAAAFPICEEFTAELDGTENTTATCRLNPSLWHMVRTDDALTGGEANTLYLWYKTSVETLSAAQVEIYWRQ